MEIKVGGIYKVKNDVFAEDAVLKKATMVKVLRIDAFCFTQMAMVSEFTEKEIKENITLDSVIWYISSDNLEEAENVEKAKNLASKGQERLEIDIAFVGNSTTAYLIKKGAPAKQATAYCAPDDKFSIEVGAKLALERLFEKKSDVSMPSTYRISAYERMASTFADLSDINKRAEERNAKRAEEKRLENSATLIRKIADHYGLNNQKLKLQEETGELITASAKPDIDHLVEEMADVSIMIEQVVYLLKKENLFAETREKKLDRQIKRIEKERHCFACKNLPIANYKEPCKSCLCEHNRPNWEKDEK